MAGTGPAPNEASRRQAKLAGSWLDLPRGGYDGPIPDFPLVVNEDVEKGQRELEVWAAIWRSPQAAAWDLNGWIYDIGLYVRSFVEGECGDLDHVKEARMWSDRLGLNPTAMLKNRWRVRGDELAEKRDETKPGRPKKKRALVAVDDALAGS